MNRPSRPTALPHDVDELLRRAVGLSGHCLGDLAQWLDVALPPRPHAAKGWIGELVETGLGAPAGSRPEPDFAALGVELKTIPVRADGQPTESTWVTRVPLVNAGHDTWRTSAVYAKLACVLWMPVQDAATAPLSERRLGSPLLWRPDADQEARLRADWQDLMELVMVGRVDEITGRHGACLQIRPKGRNARQLDPGVGVDGHLTRVHPRGFYLRASFTAEILARGFGLAR